jgi:hypothetical protein
MILCNLITLNHNQQHQVSEVAFKTLHDLLRWHGHTCKIKTLTLGYRERKWRTKNNKGNTKDVDSRVFTRMLQKDRQTVALLYPFATSLARG